MFTIRRPCISFRTATVPVHSCTPAGLQDLLTVTVPISTLLANAGTSAATKKINHSGPLRRTSCLPARTTVTTHFSFKSRSLFIGTPLYHNHKFEISEPVFRVQRVQSP